jgi:hypothetical protein
MCNNVGYLERCCLQRSLSAIVSLTISDANAAWGYIEVLSVAITPLERQVSWTLGNSQVRVISPTWTSVFIDFWDHCFRQFLKPRLSPVINSAKVRLSMCLLQTVNYRGCHQLWIPRESHQLLSRKTRRIPRVLPVFKILINGLTPAIKENRPKPRFFSHFISRGQSQKFRP